MGALSRLVVSIAAALHLRGACAARCLLPALAVATLCACGPGGGGGGGGGSSPSRPIKIVAVEADTFAPAVGQAVEIRWVIDEGTTRLVRQTAKTVTAKLNSPGFTVLDVADSALPPPGNLTLDARGVLITAYANDLRATFTLVVQGEDGSSDSVAFEWGAATANHLTIDVESTFLPAYPRLPFFAFDDGLIYHFQQFTAFFDPPANRNKIIDSLLAPSFPGGFSDNLPFRLLSKSALESEGFKPTGGRAYMFDCVNAELPIQANAYIYGQGLHYGGIGGPAPGTVTDASGGKKVRAVATDGNFEQIFLCIPLFIDFNRSTVRVLDVVLGNASQGLACALSCSTVQGFTFRQFINDAVISFSGTSGSGDGTLKGSIPKMVLAQDVVRTTGQGFLAQIVLSGIDFQVPLLEDQHGLFPRIKID